MEKQIINVAALKQELHNAGEKFNKHDFREGKILEGLNLATNVINKMAKVEDSEMFSWAQKEVELAIASEKKSAEGTDDWQYGVGCYESAMKAYETLLEDNHSGASIQITKSILNRLVDGKCLTPIEDTDEVWNEISERDGIHEYQCSRMSSLFKKVDKDGKVTYSDINRTTCFDISDPSVGYHNGLATRLVDSIFPIEMPYLAPGKPFRVFTEEFLLDPENGDWDTIAYLYILLPDGRKIDLNRYFKDNGNKLVPIEKEEFEERKKQAKEKKIVNFPKTNISENKEDVNNEQT